MQKYNYFLKYAIVGRKNDSDEALFMIHESHIDVGRPTYDTRCGRAEDIQISLETPWKLHGGTSSRYRHHIGTISVPHRHHVGTQY